MSDSFIDLLGRAIQDLDSDGRFPDVFLRDLRSQARSILNSGETAHVGPEGLLGPWEELPAGVRNQLRSWAEEEIRVFMALHPRGRVWPTVIRGLHTLDRYLADKDRSPRMRRWSMRWSARLSLRPELTWRDAGRRIRVRRWWRGRRPRITDLLTALGKDPHWAMGTYVESARVDARCRGYFHDPDRNVVWAYLLGLDLVPTPSGVVCYEANLNTGLHQITREGYWEEDPIPLGLRRFAQDRGFHRVFWMANTQTPMEPWFYSQLWNGLTPHGVGLTVLEDPRNPPRRDIPQGLPVPARSHFPPADPPSDSLVVRVRNYRIGPDRLLGEKDYFVQTVGRELGKLEGQPARVLPLSRDPGPVALPPDPGLPNLVYKIPDRDQGRGVFFLRARDPDHARALAQELDRSLGGTKGLFQPWVSSDLLQGRRIFDYRTIVLVSPVGNLYLGARRRETVTPLPDVLPEGIVDDRRPFINTGYWGNITVPMDPTDDPKLRDASLAVAEGVSRVLERGFRTRP